MKSVIEEVAKDIRERIADIQVNIDIEREQYEERVARFVEDKKRLEAALADLVGEITTEEEEPPTPEATSTSERLSSLMGEVEDEVEATKKPQKPKRRPPEPDITSEEVLNWFKQHSDEGGSAIGIVRDLRPGSASSRLTGQVAAILEGLKGSGVIHEKGIVPRRRWYLKDTEEPSEEDTSERRITEEDVRNYAQRHPNQELSANSIAKGICDEWGTELRSRDRQHVQKFVKVLLAKGTLREESGADQRVRKLFFNKPKAGDATSRLRLTPPEKEAVEWYDKPQRRGMTVEGTGQRILGAAHTARKDLNSLLKAARSQGASLDRRGGHIYVEFRQRSTKLPSSPNSNLQAVRTRLRLIGLNV